MKKQDIVKAANRHKASVIRKINKAGIKYSFPFMEPTNGKDRKFIAWEEEDEAFIAGALWALKKAGIPVEAK